MSNLSLEERHHYGMCGGGCAVCYDEQAYEAQRYDAERAAYQEDEQRMADEYYEEMWWNEWLMMFNPNPSDTPSMPSSPEVF